MMDPDYDVFVEIVESGGISAAARRRRLSPASISKRLARLEERLGARLIHRTTRRISLTSLGHRFHHDLLAIRTALKEAEDGVAGRTGEVSGPLRISAPTSFGRKHLAPRLPTFLVRYPRVEVDLDLSDGFVDLMAGHLDLAVRISARVDGNLVGHRLATSRRVLCAAPAYLVAEGTPTTLEDLYTHRLLAAKGQLPWQLDGPNGTVIHQGRSSVSTNSSEVVRELAVGGCGVALRSLWDVAPALASGALVRVLPDYEGSHDVAIWAVHPPTPRLPAAPRAFVNYLVAHFQNGAPWD